MITKLPSLIFWIALFQFVGFILGKMSRAGIKDWYGALNKSAIHPPNIAFPVVWSVLYVGLAIVGWKLWNSRGEEWANFSWYIYLVQILMNWAWTPLFFQLHRVLLSFFWIVMLIILALTLIFFTWEQSKLILWILTPYTLWLMFAAYLTYIIWLEN